MSINITIIIFLKGAFLQMFEAYVHIHQCNERKRDTVASRNVAPRLGRRKALDMRPGRHVTYLVAVFWRVYIFPVNFTDSLPHPVVKFPNVGAIKIGISFSLQWCPHTTRCIYLHVLLINHRWIYCIWTKSEAK